MVMSSPAGNLPRTEVDDLIDDVGVLPSAQPLTEVLKDAVKGFLLGNPSPEELLGGLRDGVKALCEEGGVAVESLFTYEGKGNGKGTSCILMHAL